jgi:hypothetical protein
MAFLGMVMAATTASAAGLHIVEARLDNGADRLTAGSIEGNRLSLGSQASRQSINTGGAGLAALLVGQQNAGKIAARLGEWEKVNRMILTLPMVPARLVGGGQFSRQVSPNDLARLTREYAKLAQGVIPAPAVKYISRPELEAGVGLPGGHDRIAIVHRGSYFDVFVIHLNTNSGVAFTGDPHINTFDNGTVGPQYGDWVSNSMRFEFTGLSIWAESTGGGPTNGFGIVKEMLAVSGRGWLRVRGLDTPAPVAESGECGAAYACAAVRAQVASASELTYIPSIKELRLADGSRPAPPPSASHYDKVVPARVVSQFEGIETRALAPVGKPTSQDDELFERFKEAATASGSNEEAIKGPAVQFKNEAQQVGTAMSENLVVRGQLLSRAQALKNLIDRTDEEARQPTTSPRRARELAEESDGKRAELKKLLEEIEHLDAKGEQEIGGVLK